MADDEQFTLIEIDSPEGKAAKRSILDYQRMKEENADAGREARKKEKEKRKIVFEKILACGIKPDADGIYHFAINGTDYQFNQDSQLKIHKRKIANSEPQEPDEAQQLEGAEQQSRRKRVANAD